ncbi:flippase-like domain-containing protein, partial [bacterium]|nr:flippase-like domain-containing protein [bacterium]
NLDFREFFEAIKQFDIKYLFFLAVSIVISLSFRAVCFKELMSKTVKLPLADMIPLCITGAGLNIVLPARAGDFFRAFYTGLKYKTDKVKVLGIVMLERFFDIIIITSMLLFAIILYNKSPLARNLCYTAIAVFVCSLIVILLAVYFNKIDSICGFLKDKTENFPKKLKAIVHLILRIINRFCNSFVAGFDVVKSPQKLIKVLFYSAFIWVFECINYYLIIQGFHCEVSPSVVLFIISFIAMACMIPSSSIFMGPYQFAVIAAFEIYNIPKETALAISVIEQSGVTIVTLIITAIFLLKNNISFNELKEDIIFDKEK